MKFIADLHIHSHFSRATSKDLTFEHLARWAQLKGVHIVGTGDLSHPGWLQEMKEKLEPAEEGLFRLKSDYATAVQREIPPACQGSQNPVRFVLSGEISNIYARGGKTRKIHNIVFAPSFEAVEKLQAALERIGNIRADGRPILGLDSRDLLEIVLATDPQCYLIPAHIWTPWFSLLGSKSGFDSVAECFGDLTPHIFALETGLSSDPPMNWRVADLDRYTLVSNSDAHSAEKLAREATLFDTELSYPALFAALQTGDPATCQGTIEFFPEEGKYHFDGHRNCGIRWDPVTTLAHQGICPKCGKEVTVGVMHRVELLADRPQGGRPPRIHPFHSLIPLPEILAEVHGVGPDSKQVGAEYLKLLGRLGPELAILRDIPLAEITAAGGERVAEGIGRMRRGEVTAQAGYDGEYGVIKLFGGPAGQVSAAQIGLFGDEGGEGGAESGKGRGESDKGRGESGKRKAKSAKRKTDEVAAAVREEMAAYESESAEVVPPPFPQREGGPGGLGVPQREEPVLSVRLSAHAEGLPKEGPEGSGLLASLNPEQRAAVLCTDAPLIIVAGPGTGKTRTLTTRIAYLIQAKGAPAEAVLAITFTNKAAAEMAERLEGMLAADVVGRVTIKTFHAFGAMLLREYAERLGLSPDTDSALSCFAIYTDEDRGVLLRQACPELRQGEIEGYLAQISAAKNQLHGPADDDEIYRRYEAALRASQALDFDDLIFQTVRLLESYPDVLAAVRARYRWISVDEYQDINLAQYRLLRLLTSPLPCQGRACPEPVEGGVGVVRSNLCVIGDPDQAIYGFRGADRRYFLQFEQDYPDARLLHLSQNYRSTQFILDAATQVIAKSRDDASRSPAEALRIFSGFVDQVKLDVYTAPTDKAEAEYVVHQIEQMVGGTSYFSLDSGRATGDTQAVARSFADFAVLYRVAAQSHLLAEAFDRSGIPYQTAGQTPLYAHPAVREVLAYLWLLHSPGSRLHLTTILAAGKPTFSPQAVGQFSKLSYNSLADMFQLAAKTGDFTTAQRQHLATLAAFWRELEQDAENAAVGRLIEKVQQFITAQRGEPPAADAERVRRLTLRAASYGDRLADFLESTALQSETDLYDPRADRVALLTLHAAKGLEFPVVFIVGCEEGLLPYMRPARPGQSEREGAATDIEEERRLFYVGLTRARHKLILTHARDRFLFGQHRQNPPSRFVGDIEAVLKEVQAMKYRRPEKKREDVQLSLF